MRPIAERIREFAALEGFDLVGFTGVEPTQHVVAFEQFLDDGRHGEMAYLERYRERIADPSRVLTGARSVICLAVNHARPPGGFRGGGRVARYALGRDYHSVVESMLRRLVRRMRDERIGTIYRSVVDAGPVLERATAERAGLGFLSKSANLLHYKFGPWIFLAELFLDVEIESTAARAPGSCGTCTICIKSCPTQAITAPGSVDARRCISYLTIEQRGAIDDELKPSVGDWVFGCDVCSEVCPFGDGAPDASSRFGTHAALDLRLEELLALDDAQFASLFQGSPMRRAKRAGMARNAAVALGNLRRGDAAPALRRAAEHDASEVVRESAAWALRRLA